MIKRRVKNIDSIKGSKRKNTINISNISNKKSSKKVLSEIEHIKNINNNRKVKTGISRDKNSDDKKKFFIMWFGVFICMVIIIAAWMYSSKNLFQPITSNKEASKNWEKITQEFEDKISEMKKDLVDSETIKSNKEISSSTDRELLDNIIKMASSTLASSTKGATATSSPEEVQDISTTTREIFKDITLIGTSTISTSTIIE